MSFDLLFYSLLIPFLQETDVIFAQVLKTITVSFERWTMSNWVQIIISTLLAVWLPVVVLLGGAWMMTILSGHNYVTKQLRERADQKDRKGLNIRVLGYDTEAVDRHWGVLDERALQSERRFLQLDLAFPIFYGAALAVALWQSWIAVGKTFSSVWLILLVAVTVIADWTENLIHLSQLRFYRENGKNGLQPGWIRIASAATTVKLLFFTGALVLIIILTV